MLQCLLFRRLLGLQVFGIDIVAVLLEEKLHCVNKTQALMLFHETDDIASFSAAKTFVHIQVGVEHQGGCLFGMEDTAASLAVLPCVKELCSRTQINDELTDVNPRLDGINVFLLNHVNEMVLSRMDPLFTLKTCTPAVALDDGTEFSDYYW